MQTGEQTAMLFRYFLKLASIVLLGVLISACAGEVPEDPTNLGEPPGFEPECITEDTICYNDEESTNCYDFEYSYTTTQTSQINQYKNSCKVYNVLGQTVRCNVYEICNQTRTYLHTGRCYDGTLIGLETLQSTTTSCTGIYTNNCPQPNWQICCGPNC